ncbi:MAG TPA: histidine kinase [Candidatus Angelobacter sp.]|jgi:signal transduction histidine kinase|nr:histidine kinase [Candidatus Angelobacter sp.]
MSRPVLFSQAHHLALRIAGLFVWIFLALPVFDSATRNGEPISGTEWVFWLVLFFLFAPAFWISSTTKIHARWIQVAALALQTACVLGMTSIYQGYLIGFLLVIVSWEVALIMPVQVAIAWATIDSGLWIYFQEPHYHLGWRWSATGALLGFQVFAIVTAAVARGEAAAREDQTRINAELVSTRALLRETSKTTERMRIAREFHDIIGHHLTAICLHLEASLHRPPDQVRTVLEKALAAARQLLEEARSVVSGFHESDHVDLRGALEMLQRNVPRVNLHVEIPEDLTMTDDSRAHAILRCVQELTTNTLKHSDASNLWIRIYLENTAIEVEAHDDGSERQSMTPGIGISSMRQRLEQLGGGIAIDTTATHGFHVKAWLPVGSGTEVR